jgi:hypothetical protein
MCRQGLSGSPIVHNAFRSPLCFPNVKKVPASTIKELIHKGDDVDNQDELNGLLINAVCLVFFPFPSFYLLFFFYFWVKQTS